MIVTLDVPEGGPFFYGVAQQPSRVLPWPPGRAPGGLPEACGASPEKSLRLGPPPMRRQFPEPRNELQKERMWPKLRGMDAAESVRGGAMDGPRSDGHGWPERRAAFAADEPSRARDRSEGHDGPSGDESKSL